MPGLRQQEATRRLSQRGWRRWVLASLAGGGLVLSLLGFVDARSEAAQPAEADQGPPPEQGGFHGGENPRSNYWRAVREGTSGTTTVKGTGMGILIQNYGEIYREIRNGPLTTYGASLMGVMLLGLAGFYLVRGTVRLEEGRSGRWIPRFSEWERYLHWSVAGLFLVLAMTGLILLYGRAALIPVLGVEGFATTASVAKTLHNFLGPLFVIALLPMIAVFLRDNFPDRGDIGWIRQLLGRTDKPGVGRFNLGEKGWFWMVAVAGLVVSVTGLIMDFTLFGQSRFLLQISQILHGIGALLLIAGSLGHIYMGTVGLEGSLEGMVTGYVDESWAREHHDGWYETLAPKGQAAVKPTDTPPSPAPGPAGEESP